ncbi:hypothetical protein OAP32_02550 [Crocinitomicaceae bacterium]|nr:hypothetical protein [Crocinitomicaceae bacterium]
MSRRIFYPIVFLLIPLIGMLISDQIIWSIYDFILMGSMLLLVGFGIDRILKHVNAYTKRFIYISLIVLLFIFVWIELAVGVLNT